MSYVVTTCRQTFSDYATWKVLSRAAIEAGDIPNDAKVESIPHHDERRSYATREEAEQALERGRGV